jgi:hypothetical protein
MQEVNNVIDTTFDYFIGAWFLFNILVDGWSVGNALLEF